MRISEKAAQLIDYIEERLVSGHYSVNTRIPSVRYLAQKFGISYGTALRAIDFLCEQGKLEKRPKKGIFVRENRLGVGDKQSGRVIAVFMEQYVAEKHLGLCYTAFLGMQEQASKCGYTFMINPISTSDITLEHIKKMSQGAEGIILLNEYDTVLDEFNINVPTVGVLIDNSFGGKISTVNLNPISAAKIAVAYFEERGIKKVAIMGSKMPVYIARGKLFEMFWTERGYTCEWLSESSQKTMPLSEFKQNAGYFFTSDQRAHNYCKSYFDKTGRMLTDDFVILSVDGKQLLDPHFYRFPSIVVDWKSIGRIAFNECIDRIMHPGRTPMNIFIDGRLVIPESSEHISSNVFEADDKYVSKVKERCSLSVK